MGVKFGMEEGTRGPYSVQREAQGPPQLKLLLRFDQNVEYKRMGVSLARFSRILQNL